MLQESDYLKIKTAVPIGAADVVREVLGNAGAGVQGNYSHCSGSVVSIGRFTPTTGAKPNIGEIGKAEEVEEEIIEMLCHKDKIEEVITALKKVHPRLEIKE